MRMNLQGYEQGSLDLPDVSVNFYRSGGDKPPMLFLHGVADDGLCWKPTADAFKDDYDILMLDARGHGQTSDRNKGKLKLSDLADDVAGLIKGLSLEKPVVIGHSMGAATTMILACNYPELPSRIVLSDPPISFGKSSLIDLLLVVWGIILDTRAARRKSPEKMMAYARKKNPGWSEAELIPWIESKRVFGANGVIRFLKSLDFSVDYTEILKGIPLKTALIHSSDGLVRPEDKEKILSLGQDLHMYFVDGAGHSIRRDQPEQFQKIMREFL